MITGQIATRIVKADPNPSKKVPHNLVMVYGVLSIPVGTVLNEHKYTVAQEMDLYALMGETLPENKGKVKLCLFLDSAEDIRKTSVGNGPEGVLRSAIWRT
jgi:hypothetical protein